MTNFDNPQQKIKYKFSPRQQANCSSELPHN